MGKVIIPKGTAVGQGWEYQLLRDSSQSNWMPWSQELEFATDPVTNQDLVPGVLYWLLARNSNLTAGLPGSVTRPIAAGMELTESGRVEAASPNDKVTAAITSVADLLDRASPDDLDALLRAMLTVIKTPTRAALCQVNSGCAEVPTTVYPPVFRNFKHRIYTTDGEVLPQDYIVKLDGNTCGSSGAPGNISGWAFDKNHPILTPSVRIKRNGSFAADVTATIDRPDVLAYLKSQNLVPQNQTFCKFGFGWDKPIDSANGQAIDWRVYGGNTNTESTADFPDTVKNTTTCGSASVTPTLNFRRTGNISSTEGQPGTQLGVEQKYSDESWQTVIPNSWSTVGAPAGITLSPSGVFTVAADSITENVAIEIHATIGDYVFSFTQQALNTDCQRPGSLPTYYLAWNYTPMGGTTRRFSSMQDAINTVGAQLDNSAPGSLSTFAVNIASIAQGQTAYNGTGLSCETVSDGIYYVFANGGGDSIKKAITVENGIITAVLDSNYNACTAHAELTDEQRDALPHRFIFEYVDRGVANGSLPDTIRAFATRQEAITVIATYGQMGTHCNQDTVSFSSANVAIGDVMYGSNKTGDVQAGKAYNRPAEAGYWGLQTGNGNTSYVLLKTNACGEIIGRETINP